MKRQRSPDNSAEEGRSAQKPKVSSSGSREPQTGQSGRVRFKLRIWTSLGSIRKAELNDPRRSPIGRAGISADSNSLQAPSGAGTVSQVRANAGETAQQPMAAAARRGQILTEESLGEDDDASDDEDDKSNGDFQMWLEDIGGHAALQPLGSTSPPTERPQIVSCEARLIRRDKMRASFWQELEKPSSETSDLAFNLFDRYGRLDREYYEHDFRKGTGVWGNELDRGDLLLFESLQVGYEWRRRGIGRKVVDAVLERTRKKVDENTGFYAVVRPGFLLSEFDRSEDFGEREMRIAQSFWRSLGFRRVDGLRHIFRKLEDPATEEAECVSELEQNFPNDLEDPRWLVVDEKGNTALHIAAMSLKPKPVRFILSKASQLAAARNKQGYTPEEALRNRLEHRRTRGQDGRRLLVEPDEFKGFDAPAIECMATLQGTNAFDLSTLSILDIEAASYATEDQVRSVPQFDIPGIRNTLRLKYGCTCGKCIGGFLSPRMMFALQSTAKIQYGLLTGGIYEASGPDWVEDNEDSLIYLPARVRDNLRTNKSMRQGFANMFDHIAECLCRKRIPSEYSVLEVLRLYQSEWPPVTKNFLQRGGSVAAVANLVFKRTREADEWAGDGSHRGDFGEEIDELPECRNDHEFGFVSATCGYSDKVESPPHYWLSYY
ncbi:hypothetical protein SAPIO_CDS8491 [Scedosporium apiospermum]|uniref:Uncharacterized protein n=1 Tax=Pseudallescheria apiosperma TaxID=563466 RepID=A0A084FZR6_PSEDA|nr:uncharacterized protein SAPIO_CDS8491 [Scedosporium apiospermum]KEZ40578.1 hypothetical protein SAPIO_CDS8491 [Scedosporium apiospermum]